MVVAKACGKFARVAVDIIEREATIVVGPSVAPDGIWTINGQTSQAESIALLVDLYVGIRIGFASTDPTPVLNQTLFIQACRLGSFRAEIPNKG